MFVREEVLLVRFVLSFNQTQKKGKERGVCMEDCKKEICHLIQEISNAALLERIYKMLLLVKIKSEKKY